MLSSTKVDSSTDRTLTRISESPALGFRDLRLNETETSALSQFFNIVNPSDVDMLYLLLARRSGRTEAQNIASQLGWQCKQAIEAVDRMAE